MHFSRCLHRNTVMSQSATQILHGNAVFTNKLYQILARKPGNVFLSPFSLHAVLAMLYQSAQGETVEILKNVLELPDAKATAEAYKWLLDNLKTIENLILHIANKIYVKRNEEFLEEFEACVREYFYSELEALDFGDKAAAVAKLNEWVAHKTSNKIKEIVREDLINEETALFLLNVVYFKANWEEKFHENDTKVEPFYCNDGETVDVQMMKGRKKGLYKYDGELQAEVLDLPYKGKRIRMVIILPTEKNGIQNLEAKLATRSLIEVIDDNMYEIKAYLSLPKFKFEMSMDLNDILHEMGLEIIFDDEKANFLKMLKTGDNLCVGDVFQKAYIDVNEEGSEAAAVTAVRVRKAKKAFCEEVVNFVVDHPAIFLIVEGTGENSNVLFCGRLYCPKY
ncbi:antichymotrypsin-2-like isoform X1 [Zophobas morio]|uniref:antichymotrypsin-2-like isoform X1 n=1 Tax=Zophobas morio TaxID=2755281 RepID=UPI003083D20F